LLLGWLRSNYKVTPAIVQKLENKAKAVEFILTFTHTVWCRNFPHEARYLMASARTIINWRQRGLNPISESDDQSAIPASRLTEP